MVGFSSFPIFADSGCVMYFAADSDLEVIFRSVASSYQAVETSAAEVESDWRQISMAQWLSHSATLDFKRDYARRTYLWRYAAEHCALTEYSLLLVVFISCARNLRLPVLTRRNLNVLSVNGGSGSDILAFCSALSQMDCLVEHLNLTVMDPEVGWEPIPAKVVASVTKRRCKRIWKLLRHVDVRTQFIPARLSEYPLPKQIEEADVILMPGHLTVRSLEERQQGIMELFTSMKGRSVLILIDVQLEGVRQLAEEQKMEILYSSRNSGQSSGKKYEICAVQKREFVYITRENYSP